MKPIWSKILQYKKWIILPVLAVAAVTAGLVFRSTNAKAVENVRTVPVARGEVVSLVSATGTINPLNIVDISSKITGLIKEVKVKENEPVKAGQVLVVLDDTRLAAQVSQARERLDNAAANYERNQRLHSIGAISEQQLDTSRMDYKVAQANYDEAASQLDDTVIKAPIDGIVIGKPIPAGQTVAQGISNPMVILTVADMSVMQIEAQIDESDIGKVAVGQKAAFTVDAYPGKTFSGTVSSISQKAAIQQNVVYYTVLIDVDADHNMLKPTMTARVSITAGENKNALTVPLAAVKTDKNQQQYVMVQKNGQIENVNVTTGLVGDDKIEIVKGLNEGDQVVLSQLKPQTGGTPAAGRNAGMGATRGMIPR